MAHLILLRHGQSVWNQKNLFTGWVDVDLSERGEAEARDAARALARSGIAVQLCYTSFLKRAVKTLDIVLEELDRMWLPVQKSWRLNERHYGALQGLDKAETAKRYGDEQVHVWRRSWDVPPPPLEQADVEDDPRYATLPREMLPRGESLKMTAERVMPYWTDRIAPALLLGVDVLVVAHGNSLRGMVKVLSQLDDRAIVDFEIPTGKPLLYELGPDLRPTARRFLEIG